MLKCPVTRAAKSPGRNGLSNRTARTRATAGAPRTTPAPSSRPAPFPAYMAVISASEIVLPLANTREPPPPGPASSGGEGMEVGLLVGVATCQNDPTWTHRE